MEAELEEIENISMDDVNPGVIDQFLQELPDKMFRLGLRVVLAFLAVLICIQLIKLVRRMVARALRRGRADESAINFIDSFVKYALYFVMIIFVASFMGVDAASIIAILGSIGVAIGLALQGSLSNLAGGVLLLVLKPFVVGDYIMDASGNEGTVKAIDIFYTHIQTGDNKNVVLPNGTLANGTITNYTKCSKRRIDFTVGIAYEDDIKKAKLMLREMMQRDTGVLKEEPILVAVESLGDSSVNLLIRCWCNTSEYWPVRYRLIENAKYTLDQGGISIPYPQLTVHTSDLN